MTALLTEAQYRRWSFDKTNDWDDDDLQSALDDALASVEEYTNRHFELVERTESLRIFYKPEGIAGQYLGYFVSPTAPPVASVSVPAGAQIFDSSLIIGVYPPSIFSSGPFGSDQADFASVTYIGGFTSDTLPPTVGRVIATLAYQRSAVNPLLARLPAQVTAVKQGDLMVQFGRNTGYIGTGPLDRGTRYALRPWRRIDL